MKLFLKTLGLFFVIALIISASSHAYNSFDLFLSLTKKLLNIVGFFIIIFISAIVIIKMIKKVWNLQIRRLYFIFILFLIFIGCFVIISNTLIELQNDPKRYFEYALELSQDLSNLNLNNIYHQRILSYTLPIFLLFPNSLLSVQVVNVVLLLISIGIYTYLINNSFGKKTAFIFLVFCAVSPELYFVTAIASHDLASIFYFAIFLYVLNKIHQTNSNKRVLLLIILAALLILINDLQRSIKIPMILSIFFMAVVELKTLRSLLRFNLKHSFLIIIGISIFFLGSYNLIKSQYGKIRSIEGGIPVMVYSYNDLYTLGDYDAGSENRYNYKELLNKHTLRNLAFEKYMTQISHHPYKYAAFVVKKVNSFFSNSFYNYLMDKRIWNQSWNTKMTVAFLFSSAAKALIFILAAIGLLLIIISNRTTHFKKMYIVYPLVFLPLVLQSEVNPTYSMLLLPCVLFYAAYGLNKIFETNFKFNFKNISVKPLMQSFLTFVVFIAVIWFSATVYCLFTPYDITDFEVDGYTVKNAKLISKEKLKTPFQLCLKPEEIEEPVSLNLDIDKKIKRLNFFIKSESEPNDIVVKINDNLITFYDYKQDSREINQTQNNYYYYFNNNFSNTNDALNIQILSNKEFTIRDMFLEYTN